MNFIIDRAKASLVRVLKPVFGLPVYSYYLVTGRVPKNARFALSQGVVPGWCIIALLVLICLMGPPEHLPADQVTANVRAVRLLLVVMFPFVGWLIHMKAERDQLV